MIQIIPAIDLIGGECVRLTQGDYSRMKAYFKDPLDAALQFEDCGLSRLHLVDLDGAKASQPCNLRVLERIASRTSLLVEYGGGIKSADALECVFNAGARWAICGSAAVKNPDVFIGWLADYGPDRLILGADVRGGKVAVNGWLDDSDFSVCDLLAMFAAEGLRHSICTDISRDGMLCGPSVDFYSSLQSRFPDIEVTVSGGVSCFDDIVALDKAGLKSVIVGKAIYEGNITLSQLSKCSLNV